MNAFSRSIAITICGLALAAAADDKEVSITVEGDTRIVRSNGIPDHRPGRFPNARNPNTIEPQAHEFRMPAKPVENDTPTPLRHASFGVALNGVPYDPGTAEFWHDDREWNYEAGTGFMDLGLDASNAHVQPDGSYHYHAMPVGHIAKLGGDDAQMRQVGWAADGFPIYTATGRTDPKNTASPLKKLRSSYALKKEPREGGPGGKPDGTFTADFEFVSDSGDLDECNGRFEITPEFPEGTYAYHLTEDFPFIPRMWRGTPDPSFEKQGPPGGPGGGRGPGGRPPRGGGRPGFPPPPGGPMARDSVKAGSPS